MNPPTPTESPESPAITIGSRVRVNLPSDPAVHDMDGEVTAIRAVPTGYVCGKPIQVAIEKRGGTKSWYSADELELLPAEESPDDLRALADRLQAGADRSPIPDYSTSKAAELRARAEELERERAYSSDDACAACGSRYGGHQNGSLRCPEMHGKHKRAGWLASRFTPAQPKQGPTKEAFTYGMAEEAEAVYSETGLTPRQLAEAGKLAIARFEKLEAERAALTQDRDRLAEENARLREALARYEPSKYAAPIADDDEMPKTVTDLPTYRELFDRWQLEAKTRAGQWRDLTQERDQLAEQRDELLAISQELLHFAEGFGGKSGHEKMKKRARNAIAGTLPKGANQ